MEINIVNLIPKGWLIKAFENNVEITYVSNRGNYNRKSFIFPKEIIVNEELIEGIGLFLGDSDLNKKDKRHLTYASIDKDISKKALNFLQKSFLTDLKDITFLVQYKTLNKNLKEEWSKFLEISKEKIYTRYSDRHRNECLQIQVNGTVFRKVFELFIKEILSRDLIKIPELRRGLLRGLFAAEGNVGIDYLEKKPYISQITFNLSIKEQELCDLISKILESEIISYKINKHYKTNSQEIVIQNWKNYLKLWNMDLFNLCKRKNNKFKDISSKLNVHLSFNDDFRKEFFESLNMNQKDIAKIIGSWQANVCKTINGTHLLKIEQLNNLLPYSKFTKEDIIKNIEYIRIGLLTKLKVNEEILRFLKEFKSF
ncbi:MAG: hypothetical protein PHD81_01460 [Candidatus Nanoarchaeia archaeon]|nr:hypothetical protein [Candidatus Nanoarchaeia archaeon]MDD5587755.1 hypothetical protein [Candidatus Nanoarchaeia archaeon]